MFVGYIQQGCKIIGTQVVRDEKVRCYEMRELQGMASNAASTDRVCECSKAKRTKSTEYEAGEKGRDEYRSSISEISFAKGQ